MPRWPAGLHPQGVKNLGGAPRRAARLGQELFTVPVRTLIQNGVGQQIVASNGKATVVLGPQGVGTRWYPAQIQVATSTGPTDTSTVSLYRDVIDPKQQLGQTLQGGGDTLGFTDEMQAGNLVYAVWMNANPGDLATLTIRGDQVALAAP